MMMMVVMVTMVMMMVMFESVNNQTSIPSPRQHNIVPLPLELPHPHIVIPPPTKRLLLLFFLLWNRKIHWIHQLISLRTNAKCQTVE